MGADGLTKLATGAVMDMLREILDGKLPPIPAAGDEFFDARRTQSEDYSLAAGAVHVTTTMVSQRRQADYYAYGVMQSDEWISDDHLLQVLRLWGFAKNYHRQNVLPTSLEYVFSECFGLIRDRTGRWMTTLITKAYPNVAKLMNQWVRGRLIDMDDDHFDEPLQQWVWTSCTVNKGYASRRHCDINNYGPSIGRSFGSAKNDGLYYWYDGKRQDLDKLSQRQAVLLDIQDGNQLVFFDGTLPHETRKFTVTDNDRYSIIFFMIKKSWMIPTTLKNELRALGYNPPKNEAQCEQFKQKFNGLTEDRMFYQCELQKR